MKFWGYVALVAGGLLNLAVLWGLIIRRPTDVWALANILLVAALGAYLMLVGIRTGRKKGIPVVPGIGWGRVLLGTWLIFGQLQQRLHPAPNLLKPSNETQATAMNAVGVGFLFLGAWLIFLGIRAGYRQRPAA